MLDKGCKPASNVRLCWAVEKKIVLIFNRCRVTSCTDLVQHCKLWLARWHQTSFRK